MTSMRPTALAEMRAAFDARFAEAAARGRAAVERLILIGADEARAAARVRELGGIVAAPVVTRVPDGAPFLLGLTGVRGRVVPVFDLHALVLGPSPPCGPTYLAIIARPEPLALFFRGPITSVDVPRGEVDEVGSLVGGEGHLAGAARVDGQLVRILDVPSIAAVITARAEERP